MVCYWADKLSYMVDWDQDLSSDVTWETWYFCFRAAFQGIVNISLIEVNSKVIRRWYLVPACLSKIYGGISLWYFCGCAMKGTMYHV